MTQISIDTAAILRDVGMQRASDRVERDVPGWSDVALAFVKSWCLARAGIFTGEDIVDAYAARDDLVQPSQPKAWGGVMHRAMHKGYMKIRDREGKRRKGHCSPCPRYESLIVGKRATEVE